MSKIWNATITTQMVDATTSVRRVAPRCQIEALCNVDGVVLTATTKALHPVGDANCGGVGGKEVCGL